MKKYAFLFLLLICSQAFAGEKVRVYTDYNPVRILHLVDGRDFELEANKAGLAGNFKEVDESSVPQDKSDRDFWMFEKGAIKIDSVKKKSIEDAKTKRATDKASAITKLKATGMTDDEIKAIGIGE